MGIRLQRHYFMGRQTGRAWIWLLLIWIAFGAVAGYWYYNPYGAPDWFRAWLPGMANPATAKPLYRWRDDQDHLHITDRPPEGHPYEVLTYRKDTNVIPSRRRENR